jgi:DNA invertase Pin-like site-specific DNA recombinase
LLKIFSSLPEEQKEEILARQAEARLEKAKRGLVIEEMTNAEIAEHHLFKKFCSEKGVEPTKRQAGKKRSEFSEWYKNYISE